MARSVFRYCWAVLIGACSGGNTLRPEGPPPVYEPRPMPAWEAPAREADPVDALLDDIDLDQPGTEAQEPAAPSTPSSPDSDVSSETTPSPTVPTESP